MQRCMFRLFFAALSAFAVASAYPVSAHEIRPAYLELKEVSPDSYDVLWKVPARGDDQRPDIHLRLPGDCTYDVPPAGMTLGGAFIERARARRKGGLAGGRIHVHGLEATLTDVLVRVERADGSAQVALLTPERPWFVVEDTPGRMEIVGTYLRLGVEHILLGADHLLFVLGLLILVSGRRRLIGTITAFTAAHSLTLTAATLGFVHVPGPPVEAVIALSIVFVAVEIVHRRQGRGSATARSPWIVAFTFGLLHGFGFAGALRDVGLPPSAIPLALAFFNAGVEVGQLLFIVAMFAVLAVGRRATRALRARGVAVPAPAAWEIAGAYVIGCVASFWAIERTVALFS